MASNLILLLILCYSGFCVYRIIKRRKSGKACSGNCASCSPLNHCSSLKTTPIKFKAITPEFKTTSMQSSASLKKCNCHCTCNTTKAQQHQARMDFLIKMACSLRGITKEATKCVSVSFTYYIVRGSITMGVMTISMIGTRQLKSCPSDDSN